jgi:hypothetical protein
MNTNIHFRSYLAQLFLKWKIFQTKVVEKLEKNILCSVFFFRKSCRLWDHVVNVVQPGRTQIIIWRMRIACWIPKTTNPHTGCVILNAFPLQQWLHERDSMLRCSHTACLVNWYFKWNNINQKKIWWYQFVWMLMGILLSVVDVGKIGGPYVLVLGGTHYC